MCKSTSDKCPLRGSNFSSGKFFNTLKTGQSGQAGSRTLGLPPVGPRPGFVCIGAPAHNQNFPVETDCEPIIPEAAIMFLASLLSRWHGSYKTPHLSRDARNPLDAPPVDARSLFVRCFLLCFPNHLRHNNSRGFEQNFNTRLHTKFSVEFLRNSSGAEGICKLLGNRCSTHLAAIFR
jgi:hypothetical protein